MKRNSIQDILFNKKFKENVDREFVEKHLEQDQKESDFAIASLVAYILKFKKKEEIPSKRIKEELKNIKVASLGQYLQYQNDTSQKRYFLRIAIAASVVVLFSIASYWVGRNSFSSGQAEIIEFSTPKGQQTELTLPDGTFVALNYNSKLRYHISDNKKLQEVDLDGEAFFKVTKNKERTFRVITNHMSVNVLGTTFNVKSYRDDRNTETTLLEGSIELKNILGRNKTLLLKPGEKWSYNSQNSQQKLSKGNALKSTLWRNGEYYFDKISLEDLARVLERMYNINIHFQDENLKNEVYSGSVFQKDGIDKILKFINLTLPLKINKNDNEIWIARK